MKSRQRRNFLYRWDFNNFCVKKTGFSFVVVTTFILVWINSRGALSQSKRSRKEILAQLQKRHLAWSFEKVELDPCTPKTCLKLIRRNLQCDSIQREVPALANNVSFTEQFVLGIYLFPSDLDR